MQCTPGVKAPCRPACSLACLPTCWQPREGMQVGDAAPCTMQRAAEPPPCMSRTGACVSRAGRQALRCALAHHHHHQSPGSQPARPRPVPPPSQSALAACMQDGSVCTPRCHPAASCIAMPPRPPSHTAAASPDLVRSALGSRAVPPPPACARSPPARCERWPLPLPPAPDHGTRPPPAARHPPRPFSRRSPPRQQRRRGQRGQRQGRQGRGCPVQQLQGGRGAAAPGAWQRPSPVPQGSRPAPPPASSTRQVHQAQRAAPGEEDKARNGHSCCC